MVFRIYANLNEQLNEAGWVDELYNSAKGVCELYCQRDSSEQRLISLCLWMYLLLGNIVRQTRTFKRREHTHPPINCGLWTRIQ